MYLYYIYIIKLFFMKQKNKTECLRLTYSAEQSLKYEIISF